MSIDPTSSSTPPPSLDDLDEDLDLPEPDEPEPTPEPPEPPSSTLSERSISESALRARLDDWEDPGAATSTDAADEADDMVDVADTSAADAALDDAFDLDDTFETAGATGTDSTTEVSDAADVDQAPGDAGEVGEAPGTLVAQAGGTSQAKGVSKPGPAERGEYVAGIYPNDSFDGQVALTFDDGPNPATTPKVLDMLRDRGLKATFFIEGQDARKHPELIRRIVNEGHTLGNHSFDHQNLAGKTPAQVREELASTQAAVDRAVGKPYPLRLSRPPYGAPDVGREKQYTDEQKRKVAGAIRDQGAVNILWQVDSEDWKHKGDPQAVAAEVRKQLEVRRGGVVLMHDIHPQTVKALPQILDYIKSKNYSVRTVQQLVEEKYGQPLDQVRRAKTALDPR